MKLIFALGNPGSEYASTRHNTGFMVVDALAREKCLTFSEKAKFGAYVAEFSHEGEKVLLVKPTTFYNEVGFSARALVDFYKLSPADDLLVIHDDLALPLGTIRVRKKGSDAGNNGIKSLNSHIGEDYARLRIGISVEDRTNDDASFVLSRFNGQEVKTLKEVIIPETNRLVENFLKTALDHTSYRL